MSLINIDEMAAQIGVARKHMRDRVVTRPDFPRPALSLSQKTRKWDSYDFERWMQKQAKMAQR